MKISFSMLFNTYSHSIINVIRVATIQGRFLTKWMQAWQKIKLELEITSAELHPSLCSMHAVHKQTITNLLLYVRAAWQPLDSSRHSGIEVDWLFKECYTCCHSAPRRSTGQLTSVAANFYSVLYFPQTSSFPKTFSSTLLVVPSTHLFLVVFYQIHPVTPWESYSSSSFCLL